MSCQDLVAQVASSDVLLPRRRSSPPTAAVPPARVSTVRARMAAGTRPPIATRADVQTPSIDGDDGRRADDGVARGGMGELRVRHALAGLARGELDAGEDLVAHRAPSSSCPERSRRRRSSAHLRGPAAVNRASSASNTVGRSDAGSACATLPPIGSAVADLRIADLRRGFGEHRTRALAARAKTASSACVVSAPMRMRPWSTVMPFSSPIRPMSMSAVAVAEPHLEQRDQAVAAGQQLRAGVLLQQLLRFSHGVGAVVVE